MANRLLKLQGRGQSVWLDNLSRPLITGGGLKRLIREDGVSGVTSNPTIFQKAMTGSDAYDEQLESLAAEGKSTTDIYEALAIKDIQDATDLLRPVYDETHGTDGFVSLEVSPHLARDTEGTVQDAKRLWGLVDRPNLLIKIPGTEEAMPAIRQCIEDGVNVNITLLFSLNAYRQVMEAYFEAMEARAMRGDSLRRIASVASFFLSRIDVKVDKMLDEMIAAGNNADQAEALRGKTAVANAKLAYQLWSDLHDTERWESLEAMGARVQRPLWASTSTKNAEYSDVMYIEPLVGPHTVNTMPDETVDAFRDHGRVADTVHERLEGARRIMQGLKAVGIDIDKVTDELVGEGIDKFVKPFDSLIQTLDEKRKALAGSRK